MTHLTLEMLLNAIRLGVWLGCIAVGFLMTISLYAAILVSLWHFLMLHRKRQKVSDEATRKLHDLTEL